MRHLGLTSLGTSLLIAGLAGCAAESVNREDEVTRFRGEMQARLAELKIDPAVPLTPDRCVEIALQNNLDLRVRELRASLQDEKVKQSLARGLPQGTLSYVQTSRNNKPLVEVSGFQFEFQDKSMKTFTLQAVLPILDWGATYYAYRMAKDRRRQELLMVERARQTLVRDVRVAYARLAGAQRQEQLARVGILAIR